MSEFMIETQIDKLIDLLNEKKKVALSEAARILNVKESQVEQWVGTLEDRGVVELKYPVWGEPEIIIKSIIPKDLKIEAKKPEETPAPRESDAGIEEKAEPHLEPEAQTEPEPHPESESHPESKEFLESEETEIKAVSEKIADLEKRVNDIASEMDVSKLKEDLFETLLIISTLEDIEKITSYISHVERIILFLKAKNILDQTDRDLMISTLRNMSENWRYSNREDIAKIFDEMVKKIETI